MREAENAASIGFLTAVELAETGFCGGLLLLNERGRPLEFHCNSPIRPSRAQTILYGSTLRTFLLSEAIAQNLIDKCRRPPAAILTDLAELSELGAEHDAGRLGPPNFRNDAEGLRHQACNGSLAKSAASRLQFRHS
jgi:hypothetical protein